MSHALLVALPDLSVAMRTPDAALPMIGHALLVLAMSMGAMRRPPCHIHPKFVEPTQELAS